MQFENTIAVSPNIEPEQHEQDIQRIHVPQQLTGPNNLRPVLQYENTATTAMPLVDIQIKHPSTESVRRFTVNKPRDEVPHKIVPSGTGDWSHHGSTTKSPVRIRTRAEAMLGLRVLQRLLQEEQLKVSGSQMSRTKNRSFMVL